MVAMMTKHIPSLEEMDKINRFNQIDMLNILYRRLCKIDLHDTRNGKRNNDKLNTTYGQFRDLHIALNARWSPDDGRFVLPEEVLR